ncbi:uncharacterized protein FYW49_019730 isoform 2-T2 [Xenentodon cancila]
MARCRSYLRGLAICVTVLLLVSGIVMIGVGFSPIDGNVLVVEWFNQLSSSEVLLVLQVFGPITVLLAILGICAASLDYKPLLLLFSALIFVEFVAVMVVAAPLVQVQAQDSCCGLRSFEDWEKQLPASCVCMPPGPHSKLSNSSSEGSCVKADMDLQQTQQISHNLWVHSNPCGPILKSYLDFPIKLRIGIISAFATITITAIVLCLILGLEKYWKTRPVETTVDDFNRVKYQPKPSLT